MRFSEAIEYLLNGEYIRRSKWHKDYYIKLEDEVIVDSDEMNTSVSTEDIIANDWELYQHKLDIGTVIQYNDGTIGIVLSLSKSDKEYTILDENGCVETVNKTQISLINIDDGRVSLHEDSASKKLKSLVLSLQMISELVNEDIW